MLSFLVKTICECFAFTEVILSSLWRRVEKSQNFGDLVERIGNEIVWGLERSLIFSFFVWMIWPNDGEFDRRNESRSVSSGELQ